MKVTQKKRTDGKIELAVSVPVATVNETLERAIYALAAQHGIDVLNHDSLEQALLEKTGEQQFKAFTELYAADFLAPFAISQTQADIIMAPQTKAITPLERDKEFSFSVVATSKPTFELTSYEPVSISLPKLTFEEHEIDEQLADMAKNYGIECITDEWVKANIPEIGDLNQLREVLKVECLKAKESQLENTKTMLAIEQLTERFKGEIPDEIFKYTSDDMLRNFEAQLAQQGITKEEYFASQGGDEKQLSMTMMLKTREILRQNFSLDAMARHAGLTVSDKDIELTFETLAPEHAVEAREQFENTGKMYLIREATLRRKATEHLVAHAKITTA